MSISPHRVGYLDAMSLVIAELKKGIPLSIASLSKKLDVDRRTVGKVIDSLLDIQDALINQEIITARRGRRFVIQFKKRTAKVRKLLSDAKSVVRRRSRSK